MSDTAICKTCLEQKDVSNFYKANKSVKSMQHLYRKQCKQCGYVRSQMVRVFIQGIKMKDPCMDCGGRFHPYAMDFDHRDPETKRFNIAAASSKKSTKFSTIIQQIQKCDIVCSNCHRMRTYNRSQCMTGQMKQTFREVNAHV